MWKVENATKSSNIYAKHLNEGQFVIRAKEDISKGRRFQTPLSSKHAYIGSPQGPQKVSIFFSIIQRAKPSQIKIWGPLYQTLKSFLGPRKRALFQFWCEVSRWIWSDSYFERFTMSEAHLFWMKARRLREHSWIKQCWNRKKLFAVIVFHRAQILSVVSAFFHSFQNLRKLDQKNCPVRERF